MKGCGVCFFYAGNKDRIFHWNVEMKSDEQEASNATFYEKYGIDPTGTGALTPEMKCRIAKCAVLTRFGGRYEEELVEELIGDAYAECLAIKLDETLSFRSQASYLFGSAQRGALRTLRRLGKCGGHAVKTVVDCEISKFEDASYVENRAFDYSYENATRNVDDEDERVAIRTLFERLDLLPQERRIVQGMRDGLTLDEIGKTLGISRQRVRQRVAAIRKKVTARAPKWFLEIIETICNGRKIYRADRCINSVNEGKTV